MNSNDLPNSIAHKNEINANLTDKQEIKGRFKVEMTLTIEDVKKQALLLYGSVSKFGRKLGVTHPLASRLLSGSYVPLKPESIKRIADALNIDSIILTQIYDELKYKKLNEAQNG